MPRGDEPPAAQGGADRRFSRIRLRTEVLPLLEDVLGGGVAEALARTARLLRDDADALDALAEEARAAAADGDGLRVDVLLAAPAAVRRRVLRRAALAAGCPATELFAVHVEAVDALLTDWRGQAGVDLPGPRHARRAGGRLLFCPGPVAG